MHVNLNNTGDTIVEVLISIAVISVVLVGAYISTNRNTASTQDAQERSQAVKLAETQLEFLRQADGLDTVKYRCFLTANTYGSDEASCTIRPNGPSTDPAYKQAIESSNPATNTYKVVIKWDSLVSDATPDTVEMYYQP